MHLKNPTGNKTIIISEPIHHTILLEDTERGNRNFNLEVILESHQASCDIIGRIFTSQKDIKNWNIYKRINGTSQKGVIEVYGIAENESSLTINGNGSIEQTAKAASLRIDQKVILFDKASGAAVPQLTVKTKEVESAGHGASIMSIDPEMLFFMGSRGLSPHMAKELFQNFFLSFPEKCIQE